MKRLFLISILLFGSFGCISSALRSVRSPLVHPFYRLEPEAPGDRGETFSPTHVHLVFVVWQGDELITAHPVFLASDTLAVRLEAIAGVASEPAEISLSEDFLEWAKVSPIRKQPSFRWLQITGKAGRDHMGLAPDGTLVVSQTVLDAILATNPTMLGYEEWK